MDDEVLALVAEGKVVGGQFGVGCVVAHLVARIPPVVPAVPYMDVSATREVGYMYNSGSSQYSKACNLLQTSCYLYNCYTVEPILKDTPEIRTPLY